MGYSRTEVFDAIILLRMGEIVIYDEIEVLF